MYFEIKLSKKFLLENGRISIHLFKGPCNDYIYWVIFFWSNVMESTQINYI